MDVASLTTEIAATSQQGTQQQMSLQSIKSAANAQNQLAGMLEKSAKEQPALRTSGTVGTQINTTA